MGVGSRRPPLPAPTDLSSADNDNSSSTVGVSDDLATDVSRHSDRTHYSIPDDGSPVTISTKHNRNGHGPSQTSLLIEYYEAQNTTGHPTSRPSLRVRVTPSASRSKRGRDHIRISETTKPGRQSNVRRIALHHATYDPRVAEDESVSDASSDGPPVEVDLLHNASELSELDGPTSRRDIPAPSDISSMPPDILIDEAAALVPAAAVMATRFKSAPKDKPAADDSLKAPSRSRSLSKERLVQKVLEKVQKDHNRESKRKHARSDRRSRSRSVSEEKSVEDMKSGRARSSKYRDAGPEESLQPSEISAISSQSALSTNSINNPKLLNAVEDAIKKLILPELNALKEENKTLKNRSKFEETTRDSRGSPSARRDSARRVSKSSSLPDVARNLDISDDRGVREESSRHRSSRRSSHGSDKSYDTAVREESSHRRSSREKKPVKSAAAAGILGAVAGALAATALKHHPSSSSIERDRHGRRSRAHGSHGSRSRTPSLTDGRSDRASREHVGQEHVFESSSDRSARKAKHGNHDIPPLPMQSLLESDLTRDSILSVDTERPHDVPLMAREIQEVSRGSPRHVRARATPPSGSPISAKERRSRKHVDSLDEEPRGHPGSGTAAAGVAAAAALATAAAVRLHSGGQRTPTRGVSPIQSDTSYVHEEYPEHHRIKSIRSDNSIKSDRKARKSLSPLSSSSSPSPMVRGKKRPQGLSLESPYEVFPDNEFGTKTPRAEDVDEWFQHEHEHNDRLRELYDNGSNLTELDPRSTRYTEESLADQYSDQFGTEQHLRSVGAIPEYVHTPTAAVSAVASLRNPSSISVHSSERSLRNAGTARPDLDAANTLLAAAAVGAAGAAAAQYADSRRHWEAIRDRAMANAAQQQGLGNDAFESPPQSEASVDYDKPVMSANYIPVAGDMPEIMPLAMDDASELLTNPSIISGRMDGDRSYEPTPDVGHEDSHNTRDAALLATAVGVGLGLAAAEHAGSKEKQYQPTAMELHEEHDEIPPADVRQEEFGSTPGQHKDEGYVSANHAISPVRRDLEPDAEYEEEGEDRFTTQKHLRHESGLSHGMASPLYDSATGRGLDRIQSKDIVALMDHLTVRDAHRNARDTEILVTLVRSAAEMRNNFEEIKRFIAEQDRLIMNNMERGHDMTVQRVLTGPRPIPTGSPQTPRRQPSDESEDLPNKRRNMFRKALRGLTMRGSNDLGKIETMLNHLLNEVEGLKESHTFSRPSQPQTQTASLNSYEHLRAAPDSGYEPEGRAGTNSSPTQSGYISNNSSRLMNVMHSGYDGVRESNGHRISTVMEGDEELDEADRRTPRAGPASGNTPKDLSLQTPPDQTAQFQSADPTPKTDKSKSKHKSTGSSLFSGLPKVSRWSKTTTSTAPESARNGSSKRDGYSQDSPSGSNTHLDYGDYGMDADLQSADSLVRGEHVGSHNHRPNSPLVPDDDDDDDYELDDPKYHVHRNSLNLQHPQPRAGPTHLHQSHLESQAMIFENPPTPDAAEQWGSTAGFNKSRFSGSTHNRLSPVQSDDGGNHYEDEYEEEENPPPRPPKMVDDGPLVPPKIPLTNSNNSMDAYGMYDVPMMNSGMHIASPLEPIQEVRKSLETDRDSRHDLTPSPGVSATRSTQRKITGPREMPRTASSGSARKNYGVPGPSDSPVSLASFETYRSSIDTDTF